MFDDIQSATKAILGEVCHTLDTTQFIIVGGWCPLLRGEAHPGTNDVDVLFRADRDQMESAVRALLATGYHLSAKHHFQLLKPLQVGQMQFVFNVDLLHPHPSDTELDMFAEIMDLGIRENSTTLETRFARSIVLPSADILFEQRLWSEFPLRVTLPNGKEAEVVVPLMDEAGLIISKGESVKSPKRTRDARYLLCPKGASRQPNRDKSERNSRASRCRSDSSHRSQTFCNTAVRSV